jgi:hypothetical protein
LLETLGGSHPGIIDVVTGGLVSLLDNPFTFGQDKLLAFVLFDLLTIKLKGIPETASLKSLGGFPEAIIKASNDPGVLSPSDQLPSEHVTVKDVSQPLNLKALLSEFAVS